MASLTHAGIPAARELDSTELELVSGGEVVRMASVKFAGLTVEGFYDTETGDVWGVAGTEKGEILGFSRGKV